ncbi:MAG: hypothetical protein ACRC2T_10290 [Thermoguttaceae bacterium]
MRIFNLSRVLLFTAFLTLASGPALQAQYPPYEPINPYPRQTADSKLVETIRFDSADYIKQIAGISQCELESTGKTLKITSSGSDPFFTLPILASANGPQPLSGPIVIKIRMRATTAPGFEIFWMTPQQPNSAADRSARFPFANDGNWHEYSVVLNVPGTLSHIRLDPGTSKGTCEIEWIELWQTELSPLEITKTTCTKDKVTIEITNYSDKTLNAEIVITQTATATGSAMYPGGEGTKANEDICELKPGVTVKEHTFFKKSPFETITIQIRSGGTVAKGQLIGGTQILRKFTVFHPEVDAEWVTISDKATYAQTGLSVMFTKGGTGAKIVRLTPYTVKHGEVFETRYRSEILGVIHSFVHTDETLPLKFASGGASDTHFQRGIHYVFLKISQQSENTITFESDPLYYANSPFGVVPKQYQEVRNLTFTLRGNELYFERDSIVPMFGPVFCPVGEMQQAVLCGVEYLEKGEYSSSKADLEIPEHIRFAVDPMNITIPLMGIVTDKVSFGLLWDNPGNNMSFEPENTANAAANGKNATAKKRDGVKPLLVPIFAIPDFLEGRQFGDLLQNKMSIFGGTEPIRGILRIEPATEKETLEDVILWGVKKHGIPCLPNLPRTLEEQRALNLAGLEKSIIKVDGGWLHAALPGAVAPFKPNYGSDFVSTIWQLTGKMPEVPELGYGGAHLSNHAAFLLSNKAFRLLTWLDGEAAATRQQQREDGSFPYKGVYQKGHWEDTASGHCGNSLFRLMEHWRLTGNQDSLNAALKGLEYIKRFKTPRGAQVWELSLHTPDIMGASRCSMANVMAYEATGKKEYLDEARRWAITGLPFVYLWEVEESLGGKETGPSGDAVMLYATTPVFGATNWIAPNWIGLPVQWCGLDYAEALYRLAPYDDTLNWKQIADGILISAEKQQYTSGASIGLLPDSFTLKSQTPNPFDINPCVLEMLRRKSRGELANVDVQTDETGKYRIVSPYKMKINGKNVVIDGKAGTTYQILINGEPKTIESKGNDTVAL